MVSVKKILRRSTCNSSRSNPTARSPPRSPPIVAAPTIDASRTFAVVNQSNPTQSPLYLTHSDHPGLQLISLQLTGSNYDDWNAAMRIALDAKKKIRFIDGTLIRPVESDLSFRIWSRCNNMVKSWLLKSVSPQMRDLHGRFHMTNLPRTFNLTQEIQDLRQGTMTLYEYYTTLKTLWDNLESSDEPENPCVCGNAAANHLKAKRSKIVKFLA